MKNSLSIGSSIFWVAIYFGVMLFYTFLDVAIWRKAFPKLSDWLNIITIVICVCVFLALLGKTGFKVQIFSNVTLLSILLAVGSSALLYLLLDNCLDPIFEKAFPASEQAYQETIQNLISAPFTSFLQVCIIAPFIEEILMRGFVLSGLKSTYDVAVALLISSVLFALLHFNMVQTLSAFISGLILGLLYVKTGSILCCIIGHCGYNTLSYFIMVYPYI